jgi:regulatory protein
MPRFPRESRADRRARRAAVDDPAEVLAAAGRLLEVRPRSTDEVRRRLRDAGYRDDLVEGTLDRLTELGYLDDAAFAQAWVESRDRARPRGARALRDELRRMGVTAVDAEAALAAREALASGDDPGDPRLMPAAGGRADSGVSDDAAAARLLGRKSAGLLREPDPRKRRAKAHALLARAGFDPGTAGRASAAWLGTAGTDFPVDGSAPADQGDPLAEP